MLDHEITITIPGHPAPKGSLKCIGKGKGGRGHVLIEDNARTKDWRTLVAYWTKRRWPAGQKAGTGQAVGAEITFTLPRPKSHYGTGRNHTAVKPLAPAYPTSHATGDVDKLLRLILDALQDAEILPDDSAVIETTARKTYVDGPPTVPDSLGYPGVRIRLYPYTP